MYMYICMHNQVCNGKHVKGKLKIKMNWYFSIAGHCCAFCFHSVVINACNFRENHLSEQTVYICIYDFYFELSLFRNYFKYTLIDNRILYCAQIKEFYGIHYYCLFYNKILPISLPYTFRLH